jgi:5'-3' exonuclease
MADLYLVDATYELFRAYAAMPSMTAPDGAEVGAVRGLLGSVFRMIRDRDVTHLGCATDHVIESWRNALFDDGIATAVYRLRDAFDRVYIASPDKDFGQLVDDGRVVLWDRRRELVLAAAEVEEKFGVPPSAIPDWLALVGDAADGLPGVPRWGAKSSGTVLTAYGSIEAIPADHETWTVKVRGAARLAEELAAHRTEAMLYKRLATLRHDAPIGVDGPADVAWQPPDVGALRAFCDRIGDRGLPDRVETWLEIRGSAD